MVFLKRWNYLNYGIFFLGLMLRFLLLPVHSEGAFHDFYLPFLDKAIENWTQNPWSMSQTVAFPYGSALYVFLGFWKFLTFHLGISSAIGHGYLSAALVKLSYLLVDISFLFLLIRIAAQRSFHLLIYYWMNPILIYSTYYLGYTDLVVSFFIFFGVILLLHKKNTSSSIVMGLAVSCKFHAVLVIPILIYYIWNTHFPQKAFHYIGSYLAIFLIVVLVNYIPVFYAGNAFYNSIGSPEAMRLFAWQISLGNSVTLYTGIAVVGLLIARLLLSTKIYAQGLLLSVGLLMGTLLLVTNAVSGWYLWVLPFLSLFYALYAFAPKSVGISFIIFYFLNFSKGLHFLQGTTLEWFPNLIYTCLQMSLVLILYFIYQMVIQKQMPVGRRSRPLVLGLAGDSGAGKNTFSAVLLKLFGVKNIEVLEGDDYHKWERHDANWFDYTHLHPRANHLDQMNDHVRELIEGKYIFHRHYNHQNGRFTEPRLIPPSKNLLVQGLHPLHIRSLRQLYDLRIYLNPHESLRKYWKVQRDCRERGYDLQKVLDSFEKRREDSLKHIVPQMNDADLIIEFFPIHPINDNDLLNKSTVQLGLRVRLWNDVLLTPLALSLREETGFALSFEENFADRVVLTWTGILTREQVKKIAEDLFHPLRFLIRGYSEPEYLDNYEGFLQLIILAILHSKKD